MSNFSLSLRQSASRHPENTAVVDGPTRLTYARLDVRVDALAHGRRATGIGLSSTVAVVSRNRAEFLELYYAVMRVGAVFLPVNFRLSAVEIAYQLERAHVEVFFVGEESVELARMAVRHVPAAVQCVALGCFSPPLGWAAYDDFFSDAGHVDDVPREVGDVQRIMFTSGTTSAPKAAMATHGQVWLGSLVKATEFQFTKRDVNLVNGPLYHAGALDHFAATHLMVGGCVVVTSGFDPASVLSSLRQYGVTNTWLSPTMARAMVGVEGWEDVEVADLRLLLLSGEKSPEHLFRRIQDAWPGVGVHDCYGLTESSFATCVPADQARRKLGSVGRATLGTQVRVVADGGVPLRTGGTGEIQLSGLCVFPGYFEDETATREAFTDGWLRTGDLGYLDEEGFLFVVDRVKDMIRSGGENIASSEIEKVLYEVPGVVEAAVVSAPDERWGEVPVAFVVVDPGIALSAETVLAHARERLGKFKVPKHVHFVDALPRTPSGKVMKRVLRDSLAWDQEEVATS